VGAATFTTYIVQAEKEFNQMWAEIERSIGANLGVVSQQGMFFLYISLLSSSVLQT